MHLAPSKLSTWRRLYAALAAFNIAIVLLSVGLGSRILSDYHDSVALNALWTDRLDATNVLSELAASVEIAVNEGLLSGAPQAARTRINDAAVRFQAVMDAATAQWSADADSTLAGELRPDMARIQASMARLAANADRLMTSGVAARSEPEAEFDRGFVQLNSDILGLRSQIRDHVDRTLQRQLARTEMLAPLSYAVCAAVIVMVAGAMWYGRRLSVAMTDAEQQIRANLGAAQAASRAKSDFLANMSHEIRTPMTAILGYTELLETPQQHDWRECIATIRRNGEHLLSVINDILDLSKIEAGMMKVESLECSPLLIAQEVRALMAPRFQAKGLTLDLDVRFPIPGAIRSDPLRLRQILLNLTGNALKFTQRGGATISVSFRAGHAELAVADTGIGIDPARLGQLFQPFTQEDQSTTRRFGGTGLGLSISRRLARLLGGDLTAVSAPHKGSTFTATIAAGPLDGVPMLDHVPEAVALPIAPGSPVPTAPPQLTARILLAEDGPDNQRLLVRFLHTAGATVECVENGRLAVERLLGSRGTGVPPVSFDLILMDMQMPEMDGYTATRTLRDAGVRLPIIALTAHAMAGEREKCLDAGCSDYLAKPITKPALLEACRRWLTLPAKAAA